LSVLALSKTLIGLKDKSRKWSPDNTRKKKIATRRAVKKRHAGMNISRP